jgi:hypothetical protein
VPAAAGMRTTLGWAAGQMPNTVREGMLRIYPNGTVALTAWMSKMKRKKPVSFEWSHFLKGFPTQSTAITGLFDAIGNAYVPGVYPVGTVIQVGASAAGAAEFRRGHTVLFRSATSHAAGVRGRVLSVVLNGALSRIVISMTQATGILTNDPNACSRLSVYGNANREGGVMPESVNYNPIPFRNQVQIFRTSYKVTGTQLAIDPVTGNVYREEKKEKLEMHGVEMEKTAFHGHYYTEMDGDTEIRYTMGIIPMIEEYAPTNIFDYRTDPDFAGQDWLTGGKTWLDRKFEIVQRYGPMRRNGFGGSGARLGLTVLAEAYGSYIFTPQTNKFGFSIEQWQTPNAMNIELYTHPLFSMDEFDRNSLVVFPLDNISECPLRDTHSIEDDIKKSHGAGRIDGIAEEWLTETGFDFKDPYTFAYFNGIGLDNILPAP